MSAEEVDAYLAALDEPKRTTLQTLREVIAAEVPEAEQGLAYGAPVFRVGGTAVAGFAAAARHLSYLPHSGQVLASLDPELLQGFAWSKGALKFPVDAPLPRSLVATLIGARRDEAGV